MKVWEKIMLYPIGLCYWIADSAKKTGNFIGRKAKPAIAMLVAVTMMLSLMPITAFAVSSDIIVGGANLGNGSTTVYYKNGDTSGNLTGTAEDYNAKLETVGGVATLTIKNLSVAAASGKAGIVSYVSLNLVLEGVNSITGGDDNEWSAYGINVYGDLTISGDGALSVTGGNSSGTTYGESYGIYADGAITISGGALSVTGGNSSGTTFGDSCGIYAYGAITISGGTISATGGTASSGSSYGIYAYGALTISGGTISATGGTAGSSYQSAGIYSADGTTVSISGGVVVAGGGSGSASYGIYVGNVEINGSSIVVARSGSGETTKAINGTLTTNGTQIAGQVVGGEFKDSSVAYDGNATAMAIVPESYTVQNTKLTDGNTTDYTIDTNTAVVTPGTSSNGVPLNLTEAGSTITLNGDLVLINLLGEWVTPAFSFSGSSASPAKVTGSGILTAIGAAKSDGNSYGISASGNSYLTVDGVDVIAIGGTASNKSYGIGAAANVTVSNGGSVVAIGGTASNKSYGIGSYNLSVSDTGKITAIGGAVGDSAFSYGIDTYKASISDTAKVTAVGGTGGSMSASYGVGCSNAVSTDSITVVGGTLNAVAGKTGGNSYGINNAAGTVEIGKNSTGGTVTAIGGAAATFSSGVRGGTVMVGSGALNAVGGITNHTSYGIELKIALKVPGGTVEAVGEDCGIDGQYGQGVTISGGTVTAVGGSVGLISSSSGSLAGGSFTGGEMAVFCQNGVNALLASGCGYFAGETQLIPADSDATVGEANQTVTVKEAPIPHKHCVCGGTGAAGDHTSCEDITWTEWDGTGTFPGGNVYLTDDITLTEVLTISGTVNLCLNGHKVSAEGGYFDVSGTLNLCSCVAGGSIIRTSTTEALICADGGAKANLYNVTLDGGAVWSGTEDIVLERGTTNSGISSSAPLIDAGYQRTAGGHITLNSGVILQNNECSDAGDGGAITLGEDGTLVINGAVIRNNAKEDGNAGAIKAYAGAQITLNSGEIYGNEAYKHGGAIQIFGGDSTDYADAVLTMNGSTIRNNKADGVGGGVAVSDYSSFTMNGGTIKDNATTDYSKRGGGVGFGDKNTAMSISGNAVISGNVAGINANNLYIGNNDCNKLSVETMGSNANVGVTMSSPGVFSSGGASYAAQFNSDNAAYKVTTDGSNLKLVALHTHNYTYSATGNIITESCTCGHEETATVSGPTGTIVYDGTEKKGATVSYSTGWLGGTLTVTYQNNINAGQATASITKNGATASVNFTIDKAASGNTLPTGLTATYGETLADVILPAGWTWNTPSQSVGDVGQKTFAAVYTPTNSNYKTVEADLMVTVGKATLTPENFLVLLSEDWSVALPASVTYNGNRRGVTVNRAPDGYTNSGTITVKYYDSNGTLLTSSPRDVGTYTIKLDITEGRCYKAATDLTSPDWTLTIGLASATLTPPTANDLTYNGGDQSLVSVGTAIGGELEYALGTDDTTAPVTGWSGALPQGQKAGTYYIWYKVVGDDNHNDIAPACIAVTIAKKQIAKPVADSTTFTYNGSYQTYAMNGDPAFIIENNMQKNAGSYTVTVKLQDTANYEWTDGTTAVLEYTFKIEQKEIDIGWDATMFLPYTGNSLLPKATATNLVDGDTCTLTTEVVETTEGAGVIPGEWTAKVTALSNNNYKLPASGVRVIVTFEIVNGYQNYAPVVSGTNETIDGKGDGKITGVDNTMEYRKEGEISYTAISGSEVTGLHDGIYFVRYAAKTYYNPSPEAQLTIGAGRKLTVTVPQNQIGYTLITTTPELDYYGSIRVEFKLLPGYSMTENFEIYNGTEPIWQHFNQQTGILELTFVASDFDLTVAGVADISAPVAEIDIKNNKWTNFWNDITFGLFFNETQDVTITAADAGSGVNTIQYYLAGGELELDEVRAITDWVDYNGTFKIDPNNRYVVYAKVTDNAGNILYINSDGIVLDNIAPTLEGIENGKTYYGDLTVIKSDEQFYDIKTVTLDGEPMGFAEGTYGLIPADNAEHIVVVEDHAGNKTSYTVTVMKNYTVTYKADGIVVGTQIVGHGKDATAPAIPEKEGYTQTAPTWDKDGTSITADTEINAVYTINKYTVTYKADGNVVGTVEVEHGKDATAPAIPEKEGYTQTAPAWDKDGKNITADTEINAVYTINKYTVTYKADGEIVGSVTVEHSKDATAPAIPEKEGYTQTTPAWDKDGKNITADTEINAVYTINEYTFTFMDENGVYKTLTYKHGEAVTMPEAPAKDGYTVTWDTTIEKATGNATVNAVYTKNAVSDNPQTGDNSNLWLWWILLIVSAFGITVICIEQKKRKAMR